jgi:hypothetical protein
VDADRFTLWLDKFAGYRAHISKPQLTQWLSQFTTNDRDLAARVLDAVEFFREDHLTNAYRSVLGALPGWSKQATQRLGRWRFVAFSLHSGESGDRMLHTFRIANGLSASRFDGLFIHKSDLLREDLGTNDTVVFVDDFAGTGKQAVDAWNDSLGELLPGRPRTFLVLVAAITQAIQRIRSDTPLMVKAYRHLRPKDNLFAEACAFFTNPEKATVLQYCLRADVANPRGYGGCGVLIVLAHRCPNNSLPILHSATPAFRGLFPR